MKEEKISKNHFINQTKKTKQLDIGEVYEQELLFKEADAISPINKKINKIELVKLRSGEIIDIDKYILATHVEKSTHFFPLFYHLIADLLGIDRKAMKSYVKPRIVALLKRAFIYGRLPFLVQYHLYKVNPYTGYCRRSQYHYQWLTKHADFMIREFIQDFQEEAEKIVADNGNMKKFIAHFCKKFNLAYQPELFD